MPSIDAQTFYTADALKQFGIDSKMIEAARVAGMIEAVKPGDVYLYEGYRVLSWLRGGAMIAPRYRTGVRRVGSTLVIEGRLPPPTRTSTASVEPVNTASAPAAPAAINPKPAGVATAPQPQRRNTVNTMQTTDPVSTFDAKVRQEMKNGKDHRGAIQAVAIRDPELHAQYIRGTNPRKKWL